MPPGQAPAGQQRADLIDTWAAEAAIGAVRESVAAAAATATKAGRNVSVEAESLISISLFLG
jgi:hypothetical protein